jgi:hypothetical protein
MVALYTSVVGSHAWGMQHEKSDWDYFTVYQAPSRSLLLGNRHDGGHESKGEFADGIPWDHSRFEIGHHVRELMKGNINHVIALFGPSVVLIDGTGPSEIHRKIIYDEEHGGLITSVKMHLQDLFRAHPSKSIFASVNGMTTHNITKYFDEKAAKVSYIPPTTPENLKYRAKKIGQIQRLLEFGYRLLLHGEIKLEPVKLTDGGPAAEEKMRWWHQQLKDAYHFSDFPEKPDAEPYEKFVLDLRKKDIERRGL